MACCLEPILDPELVIVARGGKVANDHRESIEGKRAEIIDASPDALACASAGAGEPTVSQVGADHTRHDRGRGSQVVEDATTQTVSATATLSGEQGLDLRPELLARFLLRGRQVGDRRHIAQAGQCLVGLPAPEPFL